MPLLTLADSGETLDALDGETVLDAARRAGVYFSHSCLAGNCGACKCELVDGDVNELEHSEFALTDEEHATGLILACRTQVWGDTTVKRLPEGEIVMHPSRILPCRVERLEWLTHDIRSVHLVHEGRGEFFFSAGQYVSLEFIPGLERQYSMASVPGEGELEFHVRKVPGGRASTHVCDSLAVGDRVTLKGPLGTSYLRDYHEGPVLLMAGGSGLAPIQSILRLLLERGHRAPVRLYFGVRAERDVYNEALLERLAAAHPQFSYEIVLSDAAGTTRRSGFLHDAVAADLASVTGMKAYLAGPPPMVEAATTLLRSRGLGLRDIHADAFYDQATAP